MKTALIIFIASLSCSALAQGTYQNLDFESATLSPIPAGQFGSSVPIANALPAWAGYLGNQQVTQVLQNNFTLGYASIDILGPDWDLGGIIEGQYTVELQPGADPFGSGQNVSASISQTGLVPANTQSLEFKAATSSAFAVSLGGQNLPLSALGTGPNYTLYGAPIPFPDAGQSEALTITALAAPNTANYFDSFVFSPSAIPEPSPFVLSGIGGLLFALYRRFAPQQK